MIKSQLLCTFATLADLQNTIQKIIDMYTIIYNNIYVLQNKKNTDELYVTYNIDVNLQPESALPNTILIHRKKESNTLYTINALNLLIKEENGGSLDKKFSLNWQKFKNSIILTDVSGVKKIQTRVFGVISVDGKK
jgi:hypothetical protein